MGLNIPLNFGKRQEQAQAARAGQARAAQEMRMKTIIQGRQMAFDHIRKKVEEFTPEWWRALAKLVLPEWYEKMWIRLFEIMLGITRLLWRVLGFIFLLPLQRRIAQVLFRGGHIAKVGQGPSEWVVRIRIFKWFKPVYQCDMDIRNGRVTEEFKPKKEQDHAVQN